MPRDAANSIDPEEILKAYTLGYFPMARTHEDENAVWVLPEYRGVLPLDQAHIPRKLRRLVASNTFEMTANVDFKAVISACAARGMGPGAKVREERDETWINDQIREAYIELHRLGFAHSLECWQDGALVGGLYGLSLGGVFFGESMFSRVSNASKVAFIHLIGRLIIGKYQFIDTQFYTDHLGQFGVVEISNEDYQILLGKALQHSARLPLGSSWGAHREFSDPVNYGVAEFSPGKISSGSVSMTASRSKPSSSSEGPDLGGAVDDVVSGSEDKSVAPVVSPSASGSVSTSCVLQSIIQTS